MRLTKWILVVFGCFGPSLLFAKATKIEFAPGTPKFMPNSVESLTGLAHNQKDLDSLCFVISGYFSTSKEIGMTQLGILRANEIFLALTQQKIPEDHLDFRSLGPLTTELDSKPPHKGAVFTLDSQPKTKAPCTHTASEVLEALPDAPAPQATKEESKLIYFKSESYELDQPNLNHLKVLANLAKKDRKPIEVHGYTDAGGASIFNRNLSRLRALVIYKYLLRDKTPADQIKVFNHQETTSIAKDFRSVELVFGSPAASLPHGAIPPLSKRTTRNNTLGIFGGLYSPISLSDKFYSGPMFGVRWVYSSAWELQLGLTSITPKSSTLKGSLNEMIVSGGKLWSLDLTKNLAAITSIGLRTSFWRGESTSELTHLKKSGEGIGLGGYLNAGVVSSIGNSLQINAVYTVNHTLLGDGGLGMSYRFGIDWEY